MKRELIIDNIKQCNKLNIDYYFDNELYEQLIDIMYTYKFGTINNNGDLEYEGYVLPLSLVDELRKYNVPLYDKKNSCFEKNLSLTKECLEIYNEIPKEYKGVRLECWVTRIKVIYNNGKRMKDGSIVYEHNNKKDVIRADRVLLLDYLEDRYGLFTSIWSRDYNLFVEFKNKYDREPKTNEMYKGFNLGQWANTQRYILKYGSLNEDGSISYRGHSLTKKQIYLLNISLGPSIGETNWLNQFDDLKNYVKIHKKFPTYASKEGRFVNSQRKIFLNGIEDDEGNIKSSSGMLNKERIDMLESINFEWVSRTKDIYQKTFNNLDDVKKARRLILSYYSKINNYEEPKEKNKLLLKRLEK